MSAIAMNQNNGAPTELLEIWNATSEELVFELTGHISGVEAVAFSPDGKLLASGGGYPDNSIRIWDTQSGELLRILEGHASYHHPMKHEKRLWIFQIIV